MNIDTFTIAAIVTIVVIAVALFATRRRRMTCKEMSDYVDEHHK